MQELRRALDVGEEEGDGARRKLRAHAEIMRGSRIADKVAPQRTFPHTRAGHVVRWHRPAFTRQLDPTLASSRSILSEVDVARRR